MIEAYEIGITLALDNGVSSGVAAICQDLKVLDRAIANSSTGLLALRYLTTGLSSATPTYPNFLRPTSEITSIQSSGMTAANTAPVKPNISEPSPTLLPISTAPIALTPFLPVPVAQHGTFEAQERSPPTQAHALVTPIKTPTTITSTTPDIGNFPMVTPKPNAPLQIEKTPSIPDQYTPILASATPSPSPMPKSLYAEKIIPPQRATSPKNDPSLAISVAPFSPRLPALLLPQPSSPFHNAPTPARPVAPLTFPNHTESRSEPDPSLYSAAYPSRPAPLPPRSASATHGELILDGVRLGRWMSDHLARAADRPQSGITGFDPRISQNHAGAPNGS